MVSFDEQAILDNGAYIYNQRAEIERIADEICEKGFDSIFFTSSGGSLAMMQPFDYMVSVMSDIPVQSQVSADFLTVGNRRIGKGTLAFMASKSGDTKETVAAAKAANVEIIGGHTEVTDAVTRMITSAAVIAKAGERGILTTGGMKEGDSIVLSKWACLEGTAIIANDFADRLDGISQSELEEARGYMSYVSVVREGLYAYANGAHAMHDVTEGGVFGAAWEMSEASGVGIEIDAAKVPLKPATQKICAALGLDPFRLLSSGAMLIACPDGETLANGLMQMGINAAVIGRAGGKGVRTANGDMIAPPGADELYKLYK